MVEREKRGNRQVICPEPDIEVTSCSNYGGDTPHFKERRATKRCTMVKKPEPDSELESLKDFQSSAAASLPLTICRRNLLARNFEAALINAARSNFSKQSQKRQRGRGTAAVTAAQIKDIHVKHDVQRYREEIDKQSAKEDAHLGYLALNPDRTAAVGLTVIRETRESITKELPESYGSDCSIDDDAEDACDEGVEAADSRVFATRRSIVQRKNSPNHLQLTNAITDESTTSIYASSVSAATVHEGKRKQDKLAMKEEKFSKYEIPQQLNLPESEIAKLTFNVDCSYDCSDESYYIMDLKTA